MSEQNNVQKLKSERVQKPETRKRRLPPPDDGVGAGQALTQHRVQERLKSERVQQRLKRMQGWRLQSGGRALDRVRQFPDEAVAASYLAYASLLAGRSGHPLRASVVGNQVVLVLLGRSARPGAGITEEVLDLAEQLG